MTGHHRAVPIVLLAVLVDTIGFGIVLPVLPTLVAHLGRVDMASASRIGGWLLAVYALTHFFAGPILGSLGDRYGRRPVLLGALLVFATDYLLMAFAPDLAWLFVCRIIAGIAGAVYGPANAALADVTPPDRRGATFGLMGAAFGLGFVLGPALGGLLAGFGPRAPFLVAGGLALVNAIWIALALPETLDTDHRRPFRWSRANPFGAFAPLAAAGGALPLIFASFVWQLAHMVYPATWAFWAELALGWNAQAIGLSLAASGIAMAVSQAVITGPFIRRYGERAAAVTGMVAGVVIFAGYAMVSRGWMVFPLIVVGALQGLVFPSINALLSRMVDARNQGALQGGMASVASIAAIIGPLMLTQTLAAGTERGVPGAAFALASALAGCALLILWIGVIRRLPSAPASGD